MSLHVAVCIAGGSAESWPTAEAEATSPPSPADRCALEEALRLRDAGPGVRVTALSLGSRFAEAALRWCYEYGVDGAVRLWDEAWSEADTLATARALAAALPRLDADLAVCRAVSATGETGATPIQVSELSGWPLIKDAGALEVREGYLYARRREGPARRALVRCPLPAVVTVRAGANRPRYPKLSERLRARSRPIEVWGPAELGLTPEAPRLRVDSLGPPRPKTVGLVAVDATMSAEQRWEAVTGGGLSTGGDPSKVVRGPPADLAGRLLSLLRDAGLAGRELPLDT